MDIQKHKHAGVLTIAIFQIVLGSLSLLFNLCGLGGAVTGGFNALAANQPRAPGQSSPAELEKALDDAIPMRKPAMYSLLAVDFVISVLMLSSGIALLKMSPGSRRLTIWYAVLSIINRIVSVGYNAFLVMPATLEVMKKEMLKVGGAGGPMASGIIDAASWAGLVIAILLIVYPIIVLIVMNRPHVKAALSGVEPETFDIPQDFNDRREDGTFGEGSDGIRQAPDERYKPD